MNTKAPLHLLPGPALVEISLALAEGTTKYGYYDFRTQPVVASEYHAAILRHALQWFNGEDECPVSKASHLAHIAAGAMIMLDAIKSGTIVDNRPPAVDISHQMSTVSNRLTGQTENTGAFTLHPKSPAEYVESKRGPR